MLDQMRQRGASIFIYLIFGFLIVLFVINIAPQGNQGDSGCRGASHVVMDVDGNRASENAFRMAYQNPFNQYSGRGRVYHALDLLVRRELLAAEAEELGLYATQQMIEDEFKQGYFFSGGERVRFDQMFFESTDSGSRFWSWTRFKSQVQAMDVSMNAFYDDQKRNLQATLMGELMASSAQVSRDEALTSYLFDHNTVTYDVVAFAPESYRGAMLLTDADAERFLAAHEDQVKARYKEKEREYVDRKPELKLREIFIAKAEPEAKPEDKKADDAKKADDKKADDAKKADAKKADDAKKAADAVKPAGMPVAEAKAKLEAVREAVGAGKQKFADAARQLNTEPLLKANSGGVGWKSIENAGLGEKAVSDAVKTLKPGEMTPVITTDRGAYLVMAEERREKNLTYDQVKHELAAELARDVWSKEAAKRAAIKALEDARASKKNLADLYIRELKPGMNLEELQKRMNDPNLDPQIRQILQQQLQQQIEQQLGGGEDHGSIVIESPIQYAAWKAGDGEPTGAPAGGAAPAPAGGAAPAPAGSAGAAPAAGSAAPASAAPAPATGAPAAPKAAPVVASNDTLPAFQDVPPPKVRRESAQKRQKKLPGVGTEVGVLFDELGKGEFASRVLEVDTSYTVVQVVEKTEGKIEDFEKEASRLIDEMRKERGEQLVRDWVKSRCEELTTAGKIKPRADKVAESDDKGQPAPTVYRPCMTLR
jgi:parvulin-like peptidyl-prolyl isomerase